MAGKWLTRCIAAFKNARDEHGAELNVRNFLLCHQRASPADKQKLEAIWRQAGLGPFPQPPES